MTKSTCCPQSLCGGYCNLLAQGVAQILGGLRLACTSWASRRATQEHAQGLWQHKAWSDCYALSNLHCGFSRQTTLHGTRDQWLRSAALESAKRRDTHL